MTTCYFCDKQEKCYLCDHRIDNVVLMVYACKACIALKTSSATNVAKPLK